MDCLGQYQPQPSPLAPYLQSLEPGGSFSLAMFPEYQWGWETAPEMWLRAVSVAE